MRARILGLALILVLLALAGPAAQAQTSITGSVQGTVKDQKGEALPGVVITLSSSALVSRQVSVVTDEKGSYRFPSLPPGLFVLKADLSGFQSLTRDELRVRIGQTLAVNLVMPALDVQTEITVTGKAPVVSVVSNTVSTNINQEYLKKQPLPNNFYNIVKTAPGVNVDTLGGSGSAMLAYGGTSERQNAYTLDGVNVSDSGGGGHWLLPATMWMQEIEVGGLGANAEFGGYTGGVINGITKSGGNEFHGDLEFTFQPEAWTSKNDPEMQREKSKFSNIAFGVGGPLIKDKLWYFASGEYWRQTTNPLGASDTSDRKIPRYLGKLTWQAAEKTRLMILLEYDKTTHDRRGISETTLRDASSQQKAPGMTAAVHLEQIINNNNFLNVKITGYDGRDDYLPYNGRSLQGRVDLSSDYEWKNQAIQKLNHRHIVTLESSWSLFQDGLFSGRDEHGFKFGAMLERGYSSDVWARNGGFTYYDRSSNCDDLASYFADPTCGRTRRAFIERGYGEYDAAPEYNGFAVYAQDSMRINRWTINPGLRYGGYKAGWQKGRGDSTVYDVRFLDPRLGLVWDVTGDATNALKFHWGRYHDKMYTYLYDREASGKAAVPDQDCYWNSATGQYDRCDIPTYISARMGKVDHPYVDETLLTYERQLGKDTMIGIDLIDRRFRKIMAMVNANQDYSLLTTITNPLSGESLPIWTLNSAPDFVLTTDNGAYRDFKSAILRFEKRYSNGWQLRSSLVWTDLKGNILKSNGYASEFEDRNGLINADGRMDSAFSKWEFKVSGSMDLPWNLQASGDFSFLSGWYWTPYLRIEQLPGYNVSTGKNINLLARGSEKLPDRSLLNLRLSWNPKLKQAAQIAVILECFNVLNKGTVIDIYNRWGTYYYGDEDPWAPRSNFRKKYDVEFPREIRGTVRYSF